MTNVQWCMWKKPQIWCKRNDKYGAKEMTNMICAAPSLRLQSLPIYRRQHPSYTQLAPTSEQIIFDIKILECQIIFRDQNMYRIETTPYLAKHSSPIRIVIRDQKIK